MKFRFVGWCHKNNHDKVWVLMKLHDEAFVTIWGRRGHRLNSKIFDATDRTFRNQLAKSLFQNNEINKRIDEKVKKGYIKINLDKLDEVYPGFEEEVKMLGFIAACGI